MLYKMVADYFREKAAQFRGLAGTANAPISRMMIAKADGLEARTSEIAARESGGGSDNTHARENPSVRDRF
jgi:hypothetical protein